MLHRVPSVQAYLVCFQCFEFFIYFLYKSSTDVGILPAFAFGFISALSGIICLYLTAILLLTLCLPLHPISLQLNKHLFTLLSSLAVCTEVQPLSFLFFLHICIGIGGFTIYI